MAADNREEASARKILDWSYKIHGQLLVMMKNPASSCKKAKTQSETTTVVKNGYLFPQIAQILSSGSDLKV